jgi:argininosuccinate lyase
VGAIVAAAMDREIPLNQLPLDVMRQHAQEIDASVFNVLGSKHAVEAFVSYGSTAPTQVRAQIESWKKRLG